MIEVNAVLFGVICTLLAEMIIIIVFAAISNAIHKSKTKKTEEKDNG